MKDRQANSPHLLLCFLKNFLARQQGGIRDFVPGSGIQPAPPRRGKCRVLTTDHYKVPNICCRFQEVSDAFL